MEDNELNPQVDTEDEKRERVAFLLGTTSDPIGEIAIFSGTSEMTIINWLADPEFQKRVDHFQEARLAESRRLAYARKADRIESYSRDMQRLDLVLEARRRSFTEAGETDNNSHTGGTSGLVVHKIRSVGTGDLQQIVDEYEVDTALIKARLDIKRQLALELGDYEPNPENTSGGTVTINFTSDTPGPPDELVSE